MNNTLKSIVLVLLGLVVWIALVYCAISFLKAEGNPFAWTETVRGLMIFMIFIYCAFSPLMIMVIKDELR